MWFRFQIFQRARRKFTTWRALFSIVFSVVLSYPLGGWAVEILPSQDLPKGCVEVAQDSFSKDLRIEEEVKKAALAFPPLALQVRTVREPQIFASNGRRYAVYELDLQNYSEATITLQGIEIASADRGNSTNLLTLATPQLNAMLRPTGVSYWQYNNHPHVDANRELQAGRSALAFLCLAFDTKMSIPKSLVHRVLTDAGVAVAPALAVHQKVPVFGPPLLGTDWAARNGPHLDSHHRMGAVVFDGLMHNARRFAIDWRKFKNGQQFEGNPRDLHSYFAYGEKVFAVADGVVVKSLDRFPDNTPRTPDGFELALPMTRENLGGNFVMVALRDGSFAHYFHMKPGSVKVKPGDRVKRGQLLGQVGNSGDSRWPHLHFQLTDQADTFASEGLPFVIDRFRAQSKDGMWSEHVREFPWGDETVIDFGESARPAQSQTHHKKKTNSQK